MVWDGFGWVRVGSGGFGGVRVGFAFSGGFRSDTGRFGVVSGGSRWFRIVPGDFGSFQVGRPLIVPATGCLKTFLFCEFNVMLYRRNLS